MAIAVTPELESPSSPKTTSPPIPVTGVPSAPVGAMSPSTAKAMTLHGSNSATFLSIAKTANLNVPTGAKVTASVLKSLPIDFANRTSDKWLTQWLEFNHLAL